jgi:hypothetical protein
MVHTRYFDRESDARLAYDLMKPALLELITEAQQELELHGHVGNTARDFVDRFPT